MSRASAVYLGMIVVLIAGLWAVLTVGGKLTPPESLDGRWVAATTAAEPAHWPGLTVEQSGRYFELAFDNGPKIEATMVGHPTDGPLTLTRGPWQVTIDRPNGPDGVRTFHVDGPTAGTFTGHPEARPTTGPAAK